MNKNVSKIIESYNI